MAGSGDVTSSLATLGASGWVPATPPSRFSGTNNPYILAQSAVPVILLSSATNISATGLITGLTALPYTPSGVVQVYCFAQTGLAAGLYYARFSSTTSCQLYSDAAGTVALSGITAAAYAGGTTQATLASVTVPGGAMGPNGCLRPITDWSGLNNANAKSVQFQLGGTQFGGSTTSWSTSAGGVYARSLRNRGVQNVNYCNGASVMGYLNGVSPTVFSIDTSATQNLTLLAQLAVATDYIILEGYTVEILPG